MKSVMKTTLGILAISLAGVSVSQADVNRHDRHFDRGQQKYYAQKFDRRDHRKHQQRKYYGNHLHGHNNHPRWKHTGWKRHYWEHKRLRAIKRMHRQERRAIKRMYRHRKFMRNNGYVSYVAPAPRVTYRAHSHSHNVLPVVAGGIIGSSIANNVSHGDPRATLGGAIFGAVVGNAIANH